MEPLDDRYLTWLYELVGNVKIRSPRRTYWRLFRQLYTTEFVWFVPNDDNRVEDGRDLRYEFFDAFEVHEEDPEWMGLGCSVLEMMVALSRRLAFETRGEPSRWFWTLIENLGLAQYSDFHYDYKEVEEILDALVYRTYRPDGQGGLFPLQNPERNQREVEIWHQLSAYILEQE